MSSGFENVWNNVTSEGNPFQKITTTFSAFQGAAMKGLFLNVFKPQRENLHASCSEGAYTKVTKNLAPGTLIFPSSHSDRRGWREVTYPISV